MKRKKLSNHVWECVRSCKISEKQVETESFTGYLRLVEFEEVSERQIWPYKGTELVVCDKGQKWLSILPRDDWYCITVMMGEDGEVIEWYIDMIAGQAMDEKGTVYYDDLYLDLILFYDGNLVVDDMDELEEALATGDITREQFQLALDTSKRLKEGLLKDMETIRAYTKKCLNEFE